MQPHQAKRHSEPQRNPGDHQPRFRPIAAVRRQTRQRKADRRYKHPPRRSGNSFHHQYRCICLAFFASLNMSLFCHYLLIYQSAILFGKMPRRNYPKNRQKTPPEPIKSPSVAINFACRQKRRFTSEQQAKSAAETQELLNSRIHLQTYQCEWCRGWHLTSKQHPDNFIVH